MKKASAVIIAVLLLLGGVFVLRSRSTEEEPKLKAEPSPTQSLKEIGDEVDIDFRINSDRTQAELTVSKLKSAAVDSLEYEILYETEGLVKGVNSGSEPIEVDESGTYTKNDIDFGTCSSGVCRYDKNVGKVTLIIRFNTPDGPRIFKQEYN